MFGKIDLGWLISIAGSSLALAMLWLYGNKDRRAPIVGLATCIIWIIYDVKFEQWPLLLPTALNILIQFRNLWKMNYAQV